MASGDDRIDVLEMASSSAGAVKRYEARDSEDDDDDRDKSSIADKNAAFDIAGGAMAGAGKVHKSDRKIGHRRVGEGGEITYKKIQSTQIMGSIQLGIQHAVGGLASKPERDLLMQDFMTVETTNFPHEGSNHTPAHHYSEFRFRTYAPIAFRYFRDLFGIQPDDFLMSMCSAPLRELSNPGASGSIFYLTQDDEFIIKTVQHKEGEFLQKLLPGYYMNLNQNPRTLLPKFFGLYCYQCNSKNVRLVAMNNLLPSVVKLHQKYDLKGSTYKRKASKSERIKNSPTYKDLDFMEHHPEGIFLEADTYGALIKTIQRDCRVLESFKIMDYSLLVGIHNLDEAQREKLEARRKQEAGQSDDDAEPESKQPQLNRSRSLQAKEDFTLQVKRTQSINRQRLVAHSTAMESIQAESEPIDEEEDVPPGGIPARNARGERLLLFVGVIDILQSYRLRKKLEHTWKSMIHDGDTVSVHRPGFYAQRFLDFMAKTVFKKIPSLDLPEIKGNHRKFRTLVTSYIALKHSPSKRKSITRPIRTQEEVETPGRKLSAVTGKPIVDYIPGALLTRESSKLSPRSSMRSSLSDFTETTESTWHRPVITAITEYPSVLSDRVKTLDLRGPILRPSDANFQKRLEFDLPYDGKVFSPREKKKSLIEQMESLSEELMSKVYTGPGSAQINGSIADSGIQTDASTGHQQHQQVYGPQTNSTAVQHVYIVTSKAQNTSVMTSPPAVRSLRDVGVDTRNENSLQDIPFIDDDETNEFEGNRQRMRPTSMIKHKSMTNIPERIDEATSVGEQSRDRLSNSLNRSRSPNFIDRCKKFFTDLGIVQATSNSSLSRNETNTLPRTPPKGESPVRSSTPDSSRETSTLPKNMRFTKVQSSHQRLYKKNSPSSERRAYVSPALDRKNSTLSEVIRQTADRSTSPLLREKFRKSYSGSSGALERKIASHSSGKLEPTFDDIGHVSVVKVNGEEVIANSYSNEKFVGEVVYVNSENIISPNKSGSTIILVQPDN